MKKLYLIIMMMVLCAATLFAQAPGKFNYQAVVRNATNQLVANGNVGVRVSVLRGSLYGAAVYVETHTATTNANGLLTLEIGSGLTSTAKALAATSWWDSSSQECAIGNNLSGSNATGFSAVPAGIYNGTTFYFSRYYVYFWSSTEKDVTINAYLRQLYCNSAEVSRTSVNENYGLSVRCLRD